MRCSVLQCVAVCRSVLQCVAVCPMSTSAPTLHHLAHYYTIILRPKHINADTHSLYEFRRQAQIAKSNTKSHCCNYPKHKLFASPHQSDLPASTPVHPQVSHYQPKRTSAPILCNQQWISDATHTHTTHTRTNTSVRAPAAATSKRPQGFSYHRI